MARPTASSWAPGTLKLYESMPALGAKYCHANAIPPAEFVELLAEFVPASGAPQIQHAVRRAAQEERVKRADCTVDAPGFRLVDFAHFLGESAQLLQSQSLDAVNAIDAPGPWGAKSQDSPFWMLRACARCLSLGYHSVMHQVRGMKHCFIHPTEALYELIRTPLSVPKSFAVDMRHLATLHSVWFRSDAKNRLKWPEAVLSPAEIDAARRSVAQARSAVREVTVQDADGNAAVPGPNANAMHRVHVDDKSLVLPPSIQRSVGRWGARNWMSSRWASGSALKLDLPSPAAASMIEDVAIPWLPYLCTARLMECIGGDKSVAWKDVADRARRSFIHWDCGGATCRTMNRLRHQVALSTLRTRGPGRHNTEEDSWQSLFEEKLLMRGLLPCVRTLVARWWDELFRAWGEAFVGCAHALDQGQLSPAVPRAVAKAFLPLVEVGICRRMHWKDPEVCPYASHDLLMMDGVWPLAFGVRPVGTGMRIGSPVESGVVFCPAGVLCQAVDQILLYSVWTILGAIYEVERELASHQGREGAMDEARPTDRLIQRIAEKAPRSHISATKASLTISNFCRYPNAQPPWGSREAGHSKRVRQQVDRLENALEDIGKERRAVVGLLSDR